MTGTESDGDCPFCAPGIASATFAETDAFRAIYNVAPILPGHSLVVPKEHLDSVMDLDEAALCAFFRFARSVTGFLQKTFGGQGFNWTIQDSEEAGQTVHHLHLHVIPRKSGDLAHPGDWYPALKASEADGIDDGNRARLTDSEMEQIVSFLRRAWSDDTKG